MAAGSNPGTFLDIRRELLEAFDGELRYLREGVAEFVKRWPGAAEDLKVSEDGQSADPTVSRLIEAMAFQTARVQLRLADEQDRLPRVLLESLYPEVISPFPSCSIAQFACDRDRPVPPAGHLVPRGTELFAERKIEGTQCRFTTAYDVRLWPFQVTNVLLEGDGRLVVRMRMDNDATTLAQLDVRSVRLHLKSRRTAAALYERLVHGVREIAVRPAGGDETVLPAVVRPVGFRWPDECLTEPSPRTSPAMLLLFEYLQFPDKFAFVDVEGLDGLRTAVGGDTSIAEWDLIFRFDHDADLRVDQGMVGLGCTPIVNLFAGTTEPLLLPGREAEIPVIASPPVGFRTDLAEIREPYHSEVYRIDEVTVSSQAMGLQRYTPFLEMSGAADTATSAGYWQAERRKTSLRRSTDGRQGTQTIPGTDVFLTVTELGSPVASAGTLSVKARFTNRHLAQQLNPGTKGDQRGDEAPAVFFLQPGSNLGSIVSRIELVGPMTESRRPALDANTLWQILAHLSPSFLTVEALESAGSGKTPLRNWLELQSFRDGRDTTNRMATIVSVTTASCTKRVWWSERDAPGHEPRWLDENESPPSSVVGLVRGVEITVVLGESDRAEDLAESPLLFGAVLDSYFRSLVGINSFSETVIRLRRASGEERELRRWPPAFGILPVV